MVLKEKLQGQKYLLFPKSIALAPKKKGKKIYMPKMSVLASDTSRNIKHSILGIYKL
jgi:hypothetical protein